MSIANKLKVPDLCGAGSSFDSVLGDVDSLSNEALNTIDRKSAKLRQRPSTAVASKRKGYNNNNRPQTAGMSRNNNSMNKNNNNKTNGGSSSRVGVIVLAVIILVVWE